MILLSEPHPPRAAQSGFTFLEVLISLALTASVMGVVIVTFSHAATLQTELLHSLWRSEFAVSVLEEYKVTFPAMPETGTTADGWQWQITESEANPNPPGSLDAEMTYVAINVKVWQRARPEDTYSATTLIARLK